jgi:hypothetical protein
MPRSPEEGEISLADIEATSAEFHKLANGLSRKLESFGDWFNSLPGRVETEVWTPDPDGGTYAHFGIRVDRGKTGWQLYYAYGESTLDGLRPSEWKPVAEAPLVAKCTALSLLPLLLGAMHEQQTKLVNRLRTANQILDNLPEPKRANAKEGA